jgi:hypothetical protein
MPSSTPDWSALASQHEKLVTGQANEGPPAPAAIAAIPGTTGALAGGFTHAAFDPGTSDLSAILQFKS